MNFFSERIINIWNDLPGNIMDFSSLSSYRRTLHKCDTVSLEQVQRRFTKRLPGLRDLSYEKRLSLLNLQSLEVHRLHCDLTWCYKILFGLVCVNPDEFFKFSVSTTRGHPYKLYKQRSYHSARLSFFSERIINIWNNLPGNIMDFSSLSSFRRTLHRVDFSGYLI